MGERRLGRTAGLRASLIAGLLLSTRLAALTPPPQSRVFSLYGGSSLEVATFPIGLPGTYTFETWLWLESDNDTAPFPTFVGLGGQLGVGVNPAGRLFVAKEGSSATAPTALIPRTWVHVAARAGASQLELFVDGVKVASSPSTPIPIGSSSLFLGDVLNVSLRQTRFWKAPLSDSEISHFAENLPAATDPRLAVWWPMDDAAATGISTYSVRDLGPARLDIPNHTGVARWVRPEVLAAGPFFETSIFGPGLENPNPPLLVDFDQDSDLDIYSLQRMYHGFVLPFPYYSGSPPLPDRAYRNDGAGHFSDATAEVLVGPRIQGYLSHAVFGADFTGDGLDDVFIADAGPEVEQQVFAPNSVRVGTAAGTLVNESAARIGALNDYDHRAAYGDIDGDGDLDVAAAGAYIPKPPSANYNATFFLINDGEGNFTIDDKRLDKKFFAYTSIALIDVDLDGDHDLFLGDGSHTKRNEIALNDGTGHFTLAPEAWHPAHRKIPAHACDTCRQAIHVIQADYDNDGLDDLIILDDDSYSPIDETPPVPVDERRDSVHRLQLLLGNGDGTFRDASQRVPDSLTVPPRFGDVVLPTFAGWPSYGDIFDQNGDGWRDVLVGSNGFTPAVLFMNRGSAGFEEAGDVLGVARHVFLMDTGDVDGDQDVDIAADRSILENLQPYAPNPFPATDLRVAVTVTSGATLAQTVVVDNTGSEAAPNVALAIPVPHGHARQSIAPLGGSCGVDGHVVLCSLASLAVGDSWQVTVTSKAQPKAKVKGTHALAAVTADIRDPITSDNHARVRLQPAGPWLAAKGVQGFEFKAEVLAAGKRVAGKSVAACLPDTLCIAGPVATRTEALVQVAGGKPNGFLWPTLVSLTTAQVEVWLRQVATGDVQYYLLPAVATSGELAGLFDREGFPAPALASAGGDEGQLQAIDEPAVAPPGGAWLTSGAAPGFRFKVRLSGVGKPKPGKKVEACIAATLCAGALPTRTDVLVQISAVQSNGRRWPAIARFSPAKVEVWIEQTKSKQVRHYLLPAAGATEELPGRVDREGFLP